MMDTYIKDELKKNKVKDNYSGRFDKLTYRKHKGTSIHKLKSSLDGSYGYIYISCENTSGLILSFNGVTVCDLLQKGNSLVSLKFGYSDVLEIKGEAECLIIHICGAEVISNKIDKILYSNSIYVEDIGGAVNLYNIANFQSGKESYSYVGEESLLDIIEFRNNGTNQIAKLIKTDNLYLCTNMDNYSLKHLLDFDCEKAILLPYYGEYLVGVICLNKGKLYLSGLNNDLTIADFVDLNLDVGDINDIRVINSNNYSSAFVVDCANGNSIVYYYGGYRFMQIFATKYRKGSFCIIDNFLYFIHKENYDQIIRSYAINTDSYQVTPINFKRIILADDIKIKDNAIMVTYNLMERFIDVKDL